ncbi:MAG: hypothetical protein QF384_12890 [Alphaproteobacteria bacterium]|jgi:hypothetical protein|nr:hypothetical protein [Alphaproteobacteria bacterium]MDP6829554.1 hypothetical protein [Alphaproteobacteria bacterium]MDP6876487.1 hypothetical protein [Alphaproteobacteria bacterium]
MTSPYLQQRLRSLDEAEQDRSLRRLRNRHKSNEIANKKAELVEGDNIHHLGPRGAKRLGRRAR